MPELDIIFISYTESNADSNWSDLKARFPHAKRVHGVEGIQNAHALAAEKSQSHFFFVVDGDNKIKPDFEFNEPTTKLSEQSLYVYRCHNPMNDLVYGYGAVKLYNKKLLQKRIDAQFVDLATTITEKYVVVPEIASETHFFNTPEEAWRGAFRECAKLSSEALKGQVSEETSNRLKAWCENTKSNLSNSHWVSLGAEQGKEFGKNQSDQIHLINDFQWLSKTFESIRPTFPEG